MPRQTSISQPTRDRRRWLARAVVCALLAGAAATVATRYISTQTLDETLSSGASQTARNAEAANPFGKSERDQAVVRVINYARSMQLVTSTIDARVEVSRNHASWRGGVHAQVDIPVRYHYATDLSKLDPSSVTITSLTGACVIWILKPTRLSVELFPRDERTSVDVGWLRSRSRAGEYYLGQARKDAYDAANSRVLTPDEQATILEDARAQVAALIRSILGDRSLVLVRFIDAEPMPK